MVCTWCLLGRPFVYRFFVFLNSRQALLLLQKEGGRENEKRKGSCVTNQPRVMHACAHVGIYTDRWKLAFRKDER